MSIIKIKIRNFKSLKNIDIQLNKNLEEITCLIGKNNSGKTNLLNAINFFYSNLDSNYNNIIKIDKENPYTQNMQITLTYDLNILYKTYNRNTYVKKNIDLISKYINKNNILELSLIQSKDGYVKWFPKDVNVRKFIKKFFPLYSINTRNIKLDDWTYLWEIASELSQTYINAKDIRENLEKSYISALGEKYQKSIKLIDELLVSEGISVYNLNYQNNFKNLLYTRFGGETFLINESSTEFHSDGLKSLKYIKIIIGIISKLSTIGLKEPIIIIDEPEIGLHPKYIDEFVSFLIKSKNNKMTVILSTHSSQLLLGILRNSKKPNNLEITKEGLYTTVKKLFSVVEDDNKHLIDINETNCYFSTMFLCVEGNSELELFLNKIIIEMYPILNEIYIYPKSANSSVLRFIHSPSKNFLTPHLLLLDLDKIFLYDIKKQQFKLQKDSFINPLYDSEIFKRERNSFISQKKINTFNTRKYILKLIQNGKFYNTDLFYIKNKTMDNLFLITREYLLNYNIYVNYNTIEGVIINVNTIDIISCWIKEKLNLRLNNEFDLLINKQNSDLYKVAILLLIFEGKLNYLLTRKNFINKYNKVLDAVDVQSINKISAQIGGKTKWINDFFNYYYNNKLINLPSKEDQQKQFKDDFKELTKIVYTIEKWYNKK